MMLNVLMLMLLLLLILKMLDNLQMVLSVRLGEDAGAPFCSTSSAFLHAHAHAHQHTSTHAHARTHNTCPLASHCTMHSHCTSLHCTAPPATERRALTGRSLVMHHRTASD